MVRPANSSVSAVPANLFFLKGNRLHTVHPLRLDKCLANGPSNIPSDYFTLNVLGLLVACIQINPLL
jgi:hypothetical protein